MCRHKVGLQFMMFVIEFGSMFGNSIMMLVNSAQSRVLWPVFCGANKLLKAISRHLMHGIG